MRKILVATHGDYAKGALSSISIIAGAKENVACINAYSEEKNINEALDRYFETVTEDDEVIVLTDLFGGSVNQAVMSYLGKKKIFLITGFNLVLLLEVMMMDADESVSEDRLRSIIEGSKQQIMYVNDVLKNTNDDDFE